jgi:hypothetical protein
MKTETRQYLQALYAEEILELEAQLLQDLSCWR